MGVRRALLSGCSHSSDSPVSGLLSMSETFGWDNDGKKGWARVDFNLLGISMSGKIPRCSLKMGKGLVLGRKVGVFMEEVKVKWVKEERWEKWRKGRIVEMEKLRKELDIWQKEKRKRGVVMA